jgi:hypothetical protein
MSELDISYSGYAVRYELNEKLSEGLGNPVYEYWVTSPDDETLREFGSAASAHRDARAFARTCFVYGGHEFPQTTEMIPTSIVAVGKQCVSSYLVLIQGLSAVEAGELLDLDQATVSQYISNFAHLNR